MKPIIRVENLGKQYTIGTRHVAYGTLRDSLAGFLKSPFQRNGNKEENTIWALRDVSFDVMPGEVVGIIGRNGAGKSTLLKILSRIVEPTTGKVDLYGRVGSLLEVGTGFHAELSGRENIYLNGAILGMKRTEIDRKFDEIVAFAEVEKFIDTPVKFYSSGMYMRLAFAVAAHLEPEILIIDEVLAVGDLSFQKKCLGKIEDIANQGRTVLFVSHNLEVIQRICNKVVMFSQGKLKSLGDTADVVSGYYEEIDGLRKSSLCIPPECPYVDWVVTVNGKSILDTITWKQREDLVVELSFSIAATMPAPFPFIDISFYRFDGYKLFAIRSDDLVDYVSMPLQDKWRVVFTIPNIALASQKIYFDIGIGNRRANSYSAVWWHVTDIIIDNCGSIAGVTDDSLYAPRVELDVT